MGKGEYAGNQHILLFLQCFSQAFSCKVGNQHILLFLQCFSQAFFCKFVETEDCLVKFNSTCIALVLEMPFVLNASNHNVHIEHLNSADFHYVCV